MNNDNIAVLLSKSHFSCIFGEEIKPKDFFFKKSNMTRVCFFFVVVFICLFSTWKCEKHKILAGDHEDKAKLRV